MEILKIEFPTIEYAEKAVTSLSDCKLIRFDSAIVVLVNMYNINMINEVMIDNNGYTVKPTSDDEYTLLHSL